MWTNVNQYTFVILAVTELSPFLPQLLAGVTPAGESPLLEGILRPPRCDTKIPTVLHVYTKKWNHLMHIHIAYCTAGLYYDWTSFVSFSYPTSPTLYNKLESQLPQTSWDNLNHDQDFELTHQWMNASEFSDTKLASSVQHVCRAHQ